MGSLSIQKGKRAEREVASLLNPIVVEECAALGIEPFRVLRNLKQTQNGGFDLEGIDWLAIEVKHHKQVSLGAWWGQCCRQAGPQPAGGYSRDPVLIWKQHGGKWQVRMLVQIRIEKGRALQVVGDVTISDFLIWFRKRLQVELRVQASTDVLFPVGR